MVAYYSNGEKAVPKTVMLACQGWEAGGTRRVDRRVIRPEDVTDEKLALVEVAEAPAEFDHLNALPPRRR